MYIGQTTMTGAAVKILPSALTPDSIAPFQLIIFQNNNGSGNIRFGDSSVSSTKGILLTPTSSQQIFGSGLQFTSDVNEFYAYGTNGAILDWLVL